MRILTIDTGLLILRLGIGLSLLTLHGSSKLAAAAGYLFHGDEWKFIGFVAAFGFPAPGFFAVAAALAESAGSLFVALGAFTRVSAGMVSFTMVVAIYQHLRGGERPELAALYLIPTLTLVFTGAGKYALDELLPALRVPVGNGHAKAAGAS